MSQIPICELAPGAFEGGRYVRGVIAVRWPYSVSQHTFSIQLADEDIRRRSERGQVRVTFHGKAADALKQLGTFTRLEISTDDPNAAKFEPFTGTPRDLAYQIDFRGRVSIRRGDFAEAEALDSTPIEAVDTPVRLRRTWESPAELKRSSNGTTGLGLDDGWFSEDSPASKRQRFSGSFRYVPSTQATPSQTPMRSSQLTDENDLFLSSAQRQQQFATQEARASQGQFATQEARATQDAASVADVFQVPVTPLRIQRPRVLGAASETSAPREQDIAPSRLGFKTPTPGERPQGSPVVRPTPQPETDVPEMWQEGASRPGSVQGTGDATFEAVTPRQGPQVHFSEAVASQPATPRNVPYLDLASANEQEDLFRKLRASVPPKSDAGSSMMADEEEDEGNLAEDNEPTMLDKQSQIQEGILRRKINEDGPAPFERPERAPEQDNTDGNRLTVNEPGITTRSNQGVYGNSITGDVEESSVRHSPGIERRARPKSPSMTERGAAVQESVFRSKIGEEVADNQSITSVKSSVLVEPAPPSIDDNASVVHVNHERSMLEQQNSVQETLFRQKLDHPIEVEPGNLSLVGRAPGSHHGDLVAPPREPSMLEQQQQVQEEIFRDKVDAESDGLEAQNKPASLDHMETGELRHPPVTSSGEVDRAVMTQLQAPTTDIETVNELAPPHGPEEEPVVSQVPAEAPSADTSLIDVAVAESEISGAQPVVETTVSSPLVDVAAPIGSTIMQATLASEPQVNVASNDGDSDSEDMDASLMDIEDVSRLFDEQGARSRPNAGLLQNVLLQNAVAAQSGEVADAAAVLHNLRDVLEDDSVAPSSSASLQPQPAESPAPLPTDEPDVAAVVPQVEAQEIKVESARSTTPPLPMPANIAGLTTVFSEVITQPPQLSSFTQPTDNEPEVIELEDSSDEEYAAGGDDEAGSFATGDEAEDEDEDEDEIDDEDEGVDTDDDDRVREVRTLQSEDEAEYDDENGAEEDEEDGDDGDVMSESGAIATYPAAPPAADVIDVLSSAEGLSSRGYSATSANLPSAQDAQVSDAQPQVEQPTATATALPRPQEEPLGPIADDSIPEDFQSEYAYHGAISDLRFGRTVDLLGVLSSSDAPRKTDGPDYVWRAQIVQASGKRCRVAVFRPFRQALPSSARAGDAVVLRSFKVATFEGEFFVRSKDDSSWAVYTTSDERDMSEKIQASHLELTVSGPPPELGDQEASFASRLMQWWQERGHRLAPSAELDHVLTGGFIDRGGKSVHVSTKPNFCTVSELLKAAMTGQRTQKYDDCDLDQTLVYAPTAVGHPYVFYVTDGSLRNFEEPLISSEGARPFLVSDLAAQVPSATADAILTAWPAETRILPILVRLPGPDGSDLGVRTAMRDARNLVAQLAATTGDQPPRVVVRGVQLCIDPPYGYIVARLFNGSLRRDILNEPGGAETRRFYIKRDAPSSD